MDKIGGNAGGSGEDVGERLWDIIIDGNINILFIGLGDVYVRASKYSEEYKNTVQSITDSIIARLSDSLNEAINKIETVAKLPSIRYGVRG